jgi:hypothetical protein
MQEIPELILDKQALEKMGLHSQELFVIEYDLNSRHVIPKSATEAEKKEIAKYNTEAEEIRNKMKFALKFKIMATKHLESSWLIGKDKLPQAVEALEEIKELMKEKGFDNVDKRIRIIPIVTDEKGFESYAEMKQQYLLEFASEHIQYADRMLSEQRINKSVLWRIQKAYAIVNILVEEIESKDAQNEIRDTNEILSDKASQCEALMLKQSEDAEAEKAKTK